MIPTQSSGRIDQHVIGVISDDQGRNAAAYSSQELDTRQAVTVSRRDTAFPRRTNVLELH